MINITFTGDILPSERMNSILKNDYSLCFSKASKLKSNCDWLVGNLETPVAGEKLTYTHERYCFNTPESILSALKEVGFDMFTLANNHCMDRDEEGIVQTLENCRKHGFDTVGIYACEEERNRVFIKDFGDIKVSFINYTYGTNAFAHGRFLRSPYMVNLLQPEETKPGSVHLLNSYSRIAEDVEKIYNPKSDEYKIVKPYLDRLESDIRKAKQESDYVIACVHTGGQYVEAIDPYSIFIEQKIKEFGADIIVGNHQHIIQSCDNSDGYLKIYCQGNFLYDYLIDCGEFYFNKPLYNTVFHLGLSRNESGKIEAKKSFSVYTSLTDSNAVPVVTDAYDVFKIKEETHLKSDILRYANLFAGKEIYTEIRERYELK